MDSTNGATRVNGVHDDHRLERGRGVGRQPHALAPRQSLLRCNLRDQPKQPLVQKPVRRDHSRPQRRRLVEDERRTVEPGDPSARILDQQGSGADEPWLAVADTAA